MTLDASGNVGIGTTGSPARTLHVTRGDGTGTVVKIGNTGTSSATIEFSDTGTTDTVSIGSVGNDLTLKSDDGDISLNTTGDPATASLYVERGGNVGIGTSSPEASRRLTVDIGTTAVTSAVFKSSDTSGGSYVSFMDKDTTNSNRVRVGAINDSMSFISAGSEAMRLDASGNLLVGQTTASATDVGFFARPDGFASFTRDGNRPLYLSRLTSDGEIVQFRKDGSAVGSIGNFGNYMYLASQGAGSRGVKITDNFIPATTSGANNDNAMDLGGASVRWDDIYATNGTIQTSDRNEKQDIEALSDAEQRVSVAAKGLMRKFRWRDAVEAKGDEARTHFGIIAQDLQAAFAAEGLDAGDYAMFISTTWWETQTEVPAVEAVEEVLDEEGNVITEAVEAVDAYTRTDTYDTQEEAPEGATERTRLGVRYLSLIHI